MRKSHDTTQTKWPVVHFNVPLDWPVWNKLAASQTLLWRRQKNLCLSWSTEKSNKPLHLHVSYANEAHFLPCRGFEWQLYCMAGRMKMFCNLCRKNSFPYKKKNLLFLWYHATRLPCKTSQAITSYKQPLRLYTVVGHLTGGLTVICIFSHILVVNHKLCVQVIILTRHSWTVQAPVGQREYTAIQWLNHYQCFVNTYPLDSDLSNGQFV